MAWWKNAYLAAISLPGVLKIFLLICLSGALIVSSQIDPLCRLYFGSTHVAVITICFLTLVIILTEALAVAAGLHQTFSNVNWSILEATLCVLCFLPMFVTAVLFCAEYCVINPEPIVIFKVLLITSLCLLIILTIVFCVEIALDVCSKCYRQTQP